MSGQSEALDFKERLVATVKKEVKQVMEESVTRKFVHEQSASVTSLCAAVEACLSQGLRRRALGLFKTSSTTALLHKVAKHCSEANYISKKVLDIENADPTKRSSSSSDSTSKPPILKKNSNTSITNNASPPPQTVRYLWIRLALYEKKLARIIDHLVTNATRYYERDSLVADPDFGSILSSLLVGPCALDYTRAKAEHFWTDPPADELIQRHRISSGNPTPPSCRRPIMNFKRSLHSSEDGSTSSFKSNSTATAAKDYVESLHQNARATLLYGKNNVLVLPKDVTKPLPGYLSLHQTPNSLTIKWTPNQLMNGYTENDPNDTTSYWDYSMNINVEDIVYVHCHQSSGQDTGGTIILVGHDGVQRSPIIFPEGGHMASFLSCLETGLLPHGQLDPPIWSHKSIGKLFPWASKNKRKPLPLVMESEEDVPIDYVFRIVNKSNNEEFREFLSKFQVNHLRNKLQSVTSASILDLGRTSPRRSHLSSSSTNESSDSSNKSLSIDNYAPDSPLVITTNQTASIALVCTTMRKQIISRAFYGWLAYCRHLSTVRTHLSGLVNGRITPEIGAEQGLTKDVWNTLNVNGVISDSEEVYRLVYFGGCEHDIRKEVWPFLLGHYSFGSTAEERAELDETSRHYYETTMSEWLAVEAIVRQRDKEKTAVAVAKLSSESGSDQQQKTKQPLDADNDIENDVFEENGYSDLSDQDDYVGSQPRKDSDEPAVAAADEVVIEKPSRVNKSSTDSGNVPDGVDEENEQEESKEIEKNAKNDAEPENKLKPEDLPNLNFDKESDEFKLAIEETNSNKSSPSSSSYETVANDFVDLIAQIEDIAIDDNDINDLNVSSPTTNQPHSVIITDASIDIVNVQRVETKYENDAEKDERNLSTLHEEIAGQSSLDALQEPKSACVSPASENGGIYSGELLETFGLNLHRIEKDVQRCDRNYWYFANENLDKLRNVICTYVWEHLEVGYMQGMCDLVAPLLVIFDDESMSYSCFCRLMERMIENFPSGNAMDMHLANMRSLIQILDSEMYDTMMMYGDYTHFYFCYRWFLLDFKRELVYTDIFLTWEMIWAAKFVASSHFVLFIALALLETYRDIILLNSMDFTDVIKFFNEMAERHNMPEVLKLARNLVLQLQTIIENK
ncbi:small G protein signaling modulator 1-like isoform X2 [Sitodiplosis mosellana]|uniref:small G protein signaling modulator 1-like isoform X2 n=1 Tax=Sitodiplosis mosellana TaxID=263140 RepID=UPI002443B93F|nr:small G protein signaling modulator 1-like isoform X2 [Sitodiplosis mosellana]